MSGPVSGPMDTLAPRLEVCIDSADGAAAAQAGGAHAVELCDSLVEGGTTPSLGMLRITRAAIDIDLNVMIRPRGGDFCYSPRELEVMALDIEAARDAGADGVVLGVLHNNGTVDEPLVAALIAAARPLRVTFHRAFDMTRDPIEALETLVALGIDRVLTSGQAASAPEGQALLRELVERAGDRIVVVPGCGLRASNLAEVRAATGATEFHATAWEPRPSAMAFRNDRVAMGRGSGPREYEREVTSAAKVRALVAALGA